MIGLQPIDVLESKNYTYIDIRRFYIINVNALIYRRTIPVFVILIRMENMKGEMKGDFEEDWGTRIAKLPLERIPD